MNHCNRRITIEQKWIYEDDTMQNIQWRYKIMKKKNLFVYLKRLPRARFVVLLSYVL